MLNLDADGLGSFPVGGAGIRGRSAGRCGGGWKKKRKGGRDDGFRGRGLCISGCTYGGHG